jgi:hypothetical protein
LKILAIGGGRDWKALFRRASQIADDPSPPVLAALSRIWPDREPLLYLVWVRLECEHVAMELRKRLEGLGVGAALLRTLGPEPSPDAVRRLTRTLHVSQITVRSSHRHEEDPDDLRQVAVTEAVERYRTLTDGIEVKQEVTDAGLRELCSPPDFGIPEVDNPSWEARNLRLVATECREALKQFGPIFDGHAESIREQAHQALRDHFEKRKAKKRTGQRVPIAEDNLPSPATRAAAEVFVELDAAYQAAMSRWGPSGGCLLTALRSGESMAEAAKAAGVSRVTAHKYLKELRKILS